MDAQLVRDQEIAKLEHEIALWRQHMHNQEIGSDLYYTNGKRDADLDHLQVLRDNLKSLKGD